MTHAASNTAAPTKRTPTRAEVQPQLSPSVSANNRKTRPAESKTAPMKSTRDGVLIGDSGTNRWTSTAEIATGIAPKMNSQRHERLSTIRPDKTIPKPPPTPKTAEIRPIPTPTLSGGNSSRMIPKLSGNTAAPRPWKARKKISTQMFQAAAAPAQPTKNSASEITSSRSLPYWSPSLPRIGVDTEATSSSAVSTQVTQVVVVCSSRCNVGSAGITNVCCSA